MDIASIGGIALALLGILAGMMVEGGSITQITQPTAAMIVFGGTIGAVMLQFPMNILPGSSLCSFACSIPMYQHAFARLKWDFSLPGGWEYRSVFSVARLVLFSARPRSCGEH